MRSLRQRLPLVNLPVSVAESTFEVRRSATRTMLTRIHLQRDRYRLVAKVKDERRRGFFSASEIEGRHL